MSLLLGEDLHGLEHQCSALVVNDLQLWPALVRLFDPLHGALEGLEELRLAQVGVTGDYLLEEEVVRRLGLLRVGRQR